MDCVHLMGLSLYDPFRILITDMKKETLPHKTSVELRIERTSFCRSLRAADDSDWKTIKNLLGYLGYEAKFIHMTLDPQVESAHAPNIINFGISKMNSEQGEVQRTVRSFSPSRLKTKVNQLFPRPSWRVRAKGCR